MSAPATTTPQRRRPVRVLVVDDHPIVRDGERLLVRHDPRIEVVGSAQTGAEAVRRTLELRPDVVLLDLRLPDMLAPEVLEMLHREAPGVRVLLFTAYSDHAAIRTALSRGADGCLLKDAATPDIAAAIHGVAAGNRVIDPGCPPPTTTPISAPTSRRRASPAASTTCCGWSRWAGPTRRSPSS